jgi:pyrroloquinoline quinone (PQQ) biosynthesis protein C
MDAKQAADRAHVCGAHVEIALNEHPFIEGDADAKEKVKDIMANIWNLYQYLNAKAEAEELSPPDKTADRELVSCTQPS